MPTSQEDAVITIAAMSDKDAKPLTEAQWEDVKPKLRRGRPSVAQAKILVSLRFDVDVIDGMRSTGRGWQTRVNQVMREWVMAHSSIGTATSKSLLHPKLVQKKVKRVSKSARHEHEHEYA
jgi:uncharacterized protein (DUF4415 family)